MNSKTMSVERIPPDLNGRDLCIGIVQARFNPAIGDGLVSAAIAELLNLGVSHKDILVVLVPGALEIPLMLQKLALTAQFDALIAAGAVIRGETYHFELVCNESAAGISRVAMELDIPVINAVLTTENDAQAEARVLEKGTEAGRAAVEMANLANVLDPMIPDDMDDLDPFDLDELDDDDLDDDFDSPDGGKPAGRPQ